MPDTPDPPLPAAAALSPATLVARIPGQASCDLDGEAVVLHLDSGTYYGLNEVGARIWELLESPRTVGNLVQHLLQEYEVEAHTCEEDLVTLLGKLLQAGLVEARHGDRA